MVYLRVLILISSFMGIGQIASAQVQQFALQNVHLQKGERVVGIEFSMTAGSFIGFDPLPMGWYLTIDNDQSQQTSIKGDVRVGAAALNLNELSALRVRVRRVQFEKRNIFNRWDAHSYKGFRGGKANQTCEEQFQTCGKEREESGWPAHMSTSRRHLPAR